MTDEIIKEAFEKWYDDGSDCTKEEKAFYEQYPTGNHEIVVGFYAGFRAAERLAKIEGLEKLHQYLYCSEDSDVVLETIESEISAMLAELREAIE